MNTEINSIIKQINKNLLKGNNKASLTPLVLLFSIFILGIYIIGFILNIVIGLIIKIVNAVIDNRRKALEKQKAINTLLQYLKLNSDIVYYDVLKESIDINGVIKQKFNILGFNPYNNKMEPLNNIIENILEGNKSKPYKVDVSRKKENSFIMLNQNYFLLEELLKKCIDSNIRIEDIKWRIKK